jgi:hypothetical protein
MTTHAEILQKIEDLLTEAERLSDDIGVPFDFEPDRVGTYYPPQHKNHPEAWMFEPGEDHYKPKGKNQPDHGRWSIEHMDWDSSSLSC